MKHTTAVFVIIASLVAPGIPAFAQGMMGPAITNVADDHTATEEAAGKIVWEKLQAKQTACAEVTNDDLAALGEYFMGIMMGPSHPAMNAMMETALGKDSEEQMHVTMGKRLSGCDPTAVFPSQGLGFIPMMQMMGGERLPGGQGWPTSHMSNFFYGAFGWLGLIFLILWILWWVAVIVGILALARWVIRRIKGGGIRSAIEILKERYARGEISKTEFEEMKRTLSS